MQPSEIIHILIPRLTERGVEPDLIPGFMKTLANTIDGDPDIGLEEANARLRYLGWNEIELDYHTLQLAITCFEANDPT